MSINLTKNSTISLTKELPNLSNVTVGLGWDVAKSKGFLGSLFSSNSIDLDASCIFLDQELNTIDTVWYGKLKSSCKSVKHQGDNLTGAGNGDDEQIKINLKKLPASIKHLAITVTSFTGQSFERIENAFCRIIDEKSGELCRFTLSEQGKHTGIFIGLLTHDGNEWLFSSKGVAMNGCKVKDLSEDLKKHIIK